VQSGHDPAIGFTQRRGFRQYTANVGFGPRPQNHPWIRQLNFGASVDLRTDMENTLITRSVQLTPFRLQLQSTDNFGLTVSPTYERLQRDFEISEGVVLPTGSDYSFTRFGLSAGTANRRMIAVNAAFEWGGFFSGDREEVTVSLGVRPLVGVVANLSSEWNRVTLPEGAFDTRVFRLSLDTQFSPWMFVVNNLQYDSVSDEIGWQARFRWTVTPGNDLFVIYTQNWIENPVWLSESVGDRFITQDRRGAAKLVYTYRW